MKRKISTILLTMSLFICMTFAMSSTISAQNLSDEKQLYHLAIENQLFGGYIWGDGGVEMPENSMAAACGWAGRSIDSLYNGGGWSASGNVVRVRNNSYVTALGDVYMDATQLSPSLGNRGESSAPRKVQLWKINNIADVENEGNITTAMGVQANWELKSEVTITPDKTVALADGKGFNWTELSTPVLVKPGEVYVIVVEQGAGAEPGVSYGNPRPNEINNVLAIHPDNMTDGIAQIASDKDFYVSGAPIGTFGGNLVEVQNALAGSMYCGGNFKYKVAEEDTMAAPTAANVTKNSATINWEKAADSEVFGTVGGYAVSISENGGDPSTSYVNGSNTTSLNVTDLKANTQYTAVITALTTADETGSQIAVSSVLTFTTLADATPTSAATPTVPAATATPVVDNVNTGDPANMVLPMVMFIALAGIVIVIKTRKSVRQ